MLGAGATFVLAVVYANLLEYVFHRWVMHAPGSLLPGIGVAHVRLHHDRFEGDGAYHLVRAQDRPHIRLFTWWQATLWLLAHAAMAAALQWMTGWPVFGPSLVALAAYYVVYECLHWCMHAPAGRWIEATRLFQRLDANHRLHHRRWTTNFNVFLPLGDLMFGTLLRSDRERPATASASGPAD
jgi:hypothetical protein